MSDNFSGVPSFPDINGMMEETIRLTAERENQLAGRYDAEDIFGHLMGRVKAFQAGSYQGSALAEC
jgi:hypothetical protein